MGFSLANWQADAACAGLDAELMFGSAELQHQMKRVCRHCPVRTECLIDSLDNQIQFGLWGGLTERERRSLLRKHPNQTSWQELVNPTSTTQEISSRLRK